MIDETRTLLFSPSTPLEKAICAGDVEDALTILEPMNQVERLKLHSMLKKVSKLVFDAYMAQFSKGRSDPTHPERQPWGKIITRSHELAIGSVNLICGMFDKHSHLWTLTDGEILELARRFRPTLMREHSEQFLPFRISALQLLISEGLIERPKSENYIIALMQLNKQGTQRSKTKLEFHEWLQKDPGLVEQFLGFFEIEGDSQISLANCDKYLRNGDLTWIEIFCDLCKQGFYSRRILLDRTLFALEHDWPQFHSGWYSRFHAALKPTVAEMTEFSERYLHLCQSRIPPTVTLSLRAVTALLAAQALDHEALLDVLPEVMSSRIKGQVSSALKLLDRVVQQAPNLQVRAAEVISFGLLQNDAELQSLIIERLHHWGIDDKLRTQLEAYASGIAAQHRATFLTLINAPALLTHAEEPPIEAQTIGPVDPLSEERRLIAITELNDLVDRTAYVLENEADIDEFERVLDALARFHPLSTSQHAAFSPILKRIRKVTTPFARELARVLYFVLEDKRVTAEELHGRLDYVGSFFKYLIIRIDELIDFIAQESKYSALAAPTHQRNFIDPKVLIERWQYYIQHGLTCSVNEQQRALLRCYPARDPELLNAVRELPNSVFTYALRYTLGDEPNLLALLGDLGPSCSERIHYKWYISLESHEYEGKSYHQRYFKVSCESVPSTQPEELFWPIDCRKIPQNYCQSGELQCFAGDSLAQVRYYATLRPATLDSFFIEGAFSIGNSLSYPDAMWHLIAYLEPLLDPSVELGEMGTLLLAVALGECEPGRVAMAIDALVKTHAEQRLDTALFADTFGELIWGGLFIAPRLAKNLRHAADRNRRTRQLVFDTLNRACLANQGRPAPRGFNELLELLLELAIDLNQSLPSETREVLANMTLTGKSQKARQRLLTLSIE